jgi:hypothetical protein
MSERQAKDWHKMRKLGSVPAYTRPPSLVSLIASNRVIWAPEPLRRPDENGYYRTEVRPVRLHKVDWLDRSHDDLIAQLEARIEARRNRR